MVPISKVPKDENVNPSHTFCKVETNDDNFLKMNARMAHHGNKD